MAEIVLTAHLPLDGADIAIGETRIRERGDLAIVSVATGDGEALAAALSDGWGLGLPGGRSSTTASGVRAVRTAPDQLFLILDAAGPDAGAVARKRLSGAGYTTDQTDAWAVLELSGRDAVAALERICPLDLHPDAFPDGAAAATLMEHLSVLLVRLGPDRFLLLSARSSARSFLHAVETSCRNVAP